MCEKRSTCRKRSTCTVPGPADAREVVAAEVDEHHVLGAVLLGGEQPLGVAVAGRGRAGDRVQARARALELHVRLGRRADQREVAELEQEQVRRGVDPAQRPVDRERRGRRRPLRALREHDLERVAGPDVLLAAEHAAPRASPGRGSARAGPTGGPVARRAPRSAPRAARGSRRDRRAAPRRRRRRGRSAAASRRRRTGSPAARARRPAAARSARARRSSRSRGSRRPARRSARPRGRRRAATRSRRASSARAGPGRPTRAGSSRRRPRAGGGTPRAA